MKRLLLTTTAVALLMLVLAGPASAADSVIEGESMTRSTTNNSIIQSIANPIASGGRTMAYWQNASATKVITTGQTDQIILRAAGDPYSGYPQATLYVDGVNRGAKDITTSSYADYIWTLPTLAAGTHTVKVTYANDLYGGSGKDRNFYLDKVTMRAYVPPAICADGVDNDADGLTDYPNDPGCISATDTDETDPVVGALQFKDDFEGRSFDSSGLANPDGGGGTNGLTGGTGAPPWTRGSACDADSITPVTSPVRKGFQAAQFSVEDNDASPCTYEPNPRAQLNYGAGTSGQFFEGDDKWIGLSVYFPQTFTDHGSGDWSQLVNVWGSPYGSTPTTVSMATDDHPTLPGDRLRVSFAESLQWSQEMQRGVWNDFVFHIKFSADPSIGYIEMYKDGQLVTFPNGTTRWSGKTLYSGASGALLQIPNYYRVGQNAGQGQTLYYDEIKVGDSYVDVAP